MTSELVIDTAPLSVNCESCGNVSRGAPSLASHVFLVGATRSDLQRIKRVVAAEYSRELSVNNLALCQFAVICFLDRTKQTHSIGWTF